MANLRLIKALNEKFDKNSEFRNMDFDSINESFSGFDGSSYRKTFSESIKNLGSEYQKCFLESKSADVYLLFIDICDFSIRFSHLTNPQLSVLLDRYYDLVIPIIYEHGGEIDKIIGDGIICVFGAPFITDSALDNKVNQCAKELIEATKGTIYKSKIAINSGLIMYYNNKSIHFEDFTIIGKPITELHRLESISVDEKINFFTNSDYDQYLNRRVARNISKVRARWQISSSSIITPPLKGVTRFNAKKTMERI